jgi:hypothetical protein
MHLITRDNYSEADDAVRDILMMYVELARDQFFIHNVDVHIRFDPLKFVDAKPDTTSVYYVNLDLLQTGSALAIVALFHTYWSEEQGVYAGARTEQFRQAILGGRLSHFPDIEEVLLEFLKGEHTDLLDSWFDEVTTALVKAHVNPFFEGLAPAKEKVLERRKWRLWG